MKKFVVLSFIGTLASASLASAQFEYSGYFRAGTGFNSLGGRQKCFSNVNTSGNEFRLGNECANYGEAVFSYWFTKGKEREPFFKAVTNLAYETPQNTTYEETAASTNGPQPVEAYVEGGYIDGLPFTFWAGKRFYRASDMHMNDFRYFVNMNGNGAGIGGYDTGIGDLAVAVLQETSTTTGTPDYTNTSVGAVSKQALDLQLANMMSGRLELWAALAQVNPAETNSGNVEQQSGYGLGARYTCKMEKGENKLAIMHGTGVMENLTMGIADRYIANTNDTVKKYARTRIADALSMSINEKLDLEAGVIYEISKNVTADGKDTAWTSIGVRPTYFFSDNISWVLEAGTSTSKDDNAGKTYQLTRITTGPQIALKKGQYARPVVRAYVSNTSWNDDYKSTLSANQAYDDKSSALNFGFQGEVWF